MSEGKIAIIGLNLRLPGAGDDRVLWHRLRSGDVLLRRLDAEALRRAGADPALLADPNFVPVDGSLEGADLFDPDLFGMSPREAALIDPQQRLLLECAWELLQTIGYGRPDHRPTVGVFAGTSMNTYLGNAIEAACDLITRCGTEVMLANDKDFLTARLSWKLGLTGPSVTVQTGCSTSLVAVHLAARALLAGECDLALAGGVSVHVGPGPGYRYEPGLMFSPDGHCRAFDEDAAGTPFADGVGLVALRRLDDALAHCDRVRAVLLGSATNNDGARRVGFTAPSVDGQRELIDRAMAVAGVEPAEIGMIEAHGTGTPLGDPIELAALGELFSGGPVRRGPCALGSIKANVGHLAAAAGIAGLARAILSIEHAEVPPHPTFRRPNRLLDLDDGPFFVNRIVVPWPVPGPLRAGVTSLGMGGSNAHVVLEQAPAVASRYRRPGWRAAPLSARDPEAFARLAHETADRLAAPGGPDAEDAAFTLQMGRTADPWRAVVLGRTAAELAEALRHTTARRARPISRVMLVVEAGPGESWGDDPHLAREMDRLRETFTPQHDPASPASPLLRLVAGLSLWKRAFASPPMVLAAGLGQLAVRVVQGDVTLGQALTEADNLPLSRQLDSSELPEVRFGDAVVAVGGHGPLWTALDQASGQTSSAWWSLEVSDRSRSITRHRRPASSCPRARRRARRRRCRWCTSSPRCSTRSLDAPPRRVPIGRPIDNIRLHVHRYGRPVPVGVAGTLFVGGLCVARGYVGVPDQTRAAFVPEPGEDDGARMYDTGDLVRQLPNGELEFLGRQDRQLKIAGMRVELEEIEQVGREHPDVTDCAVTISSPHPSLVVLTAVVVAEHPPTAAELADHFRAWLPPYTRPSRFYVVKALPRMPSGKLDRRHLSAEGFLSEHARRIG